MMIESCQLHIKQNKDLGLPHCDMSEDADEIDCVEPILAFDRLLQEHGMDINHQPSDIMQPAAATIHEQYKHLFGSPIDAMLAVLSYSFGSSWYRSSFI